ncbi:MAG TPA: hypothetical protein DEB06_10235 [Phycisphaerales bacterium]|nr:hypothetical protein [Phycisphaerales bacterium]
MTNTLRIVALVAVSGLALGGCASTERDRLEQINQTSAARIEQLNQENQALQLALQRKDSRIAELEGDVRGLQGVRTDLQRQIGDVRSQQASIADQLGNLRFAALDPETDRAIQQLAAQHQDIIRYDPARGMLQFTSDLTFDSGSDVVRPAARDGLQALARILNGSSASGYDLRIVGHTDNQPISSAATRQKFGTNRHLSAYRAIAVEEVLRQAGMSPTRLEIAGWGEFRPLVPNAARGGTAQNRRVEIFVVPGSPSSGAVESAPAPTEPAAQPASRPEMPMK